MVDTAADAVPGDGVRPAPVAAGPAAATDGTERPTASSPPPRLVADQAGFEEVVSSLADLPAGADYAIDTEFQRERTYWPRLSLVQIAWDRQVVLIDPLAVDVAPLAAVLQGPATCVAHAADQDLEVLERACGTVPARLFDTQLAAGFLGYGSPSLASLSDKLLGRRLPKGDRLTDWSRRPLSADQLAYAASDVAHLIELAGLIRARLEAAGRLAWAEEECALLLERPRGPAEPDTAWWRIRDSRGLRGSSRGVAQEVTAWRERRARSLDLPPRFVLSDLALLAIAHKPPHHGAALSEIRGIDARQAKGTVGAEILEAVRRGAALRDGQLRLPPVEDVDRMLRPAVALAAAWIGQLGKDLAIDPALLATRADLAALLRGDTGGRLATGWRQPLVAAPVRRLVAGEAALAFDGRGGLLIEARSGRPLPPP